MTEKTRNNNILGIITDPGVGGVFLIWSVHYLAGCTQYYYSTQDQWVELTENPLTKINSHGFRPNQIANLVNYYKTFNKLKQVDSTFFHCLYFHAGVYLADERQEAAKHLQSSVDKGIILSLDPHDSLYHTSETPRSGTVTDRATNSKLLTDSDEIWKDHSEYFFSESLKVWNELELTYVWDKREFIALNINNKDVLSINDIITDYDNNFYTLKSMDLFNTFDTTVYKLFDYLELSIDLARFEKWLLVYNNWKKVHYSRLQFTWYFDTIIHNIINGKSMDLEKFNLDLMQEAAIQRALIYNYSLNLKTWQLEKFTNTKQLHGLLEPNLHPIPVQR